jgi:hypothetical protein
MAIKGSETYIIREIRPKTTSQVRIAIKVFRNLHYQRDRFKNDKFQRIDFEGLGSTKLKSPLIENTFLIFFLTC